MMSSYQFWTTILKKSSSETSNPRCTDFCYQRISLTDSQQYIGNIIKSPIEREREKKWISVSQSDWDWGQSKIASAYTGFLCRVHIFNISKAIFTSFLVNCPFIYFIFLQDQIRYGERFYTKNNILYMNRFYIITFE